MPLSTGWINHSASLVGYPHHSRNGLMRFRKACISTAQKDAS